MRKAPTNTARIKILESRVDELESVLREVSLVLTMVCRAQDDLNDEVGMITTIIKKVAKPQQVVNFKKRDDDLIN